MISKVRWRARSFGFEVGPLSWCLESRMAVAETPIKIPDPRIRVQGMVILHMYLSFLFRVGSRNVLQKSSLGSACGRRMGCRKCAMNREWISLGNEIP
jgi:hypothetical protein